MVGVDRVELSSDVYKTPVLKPLYYTPLQKRILPTLSISITNYSKLQFVHINYFSVIFPNGN